jgi:hypothetical protein
MVEHRNIVELVVLTDMVLVGVGGDHGDGTVRELLCEPLDVPHAVPSVDESRCFLADDEVGDHLLELAGFVEGVGVVGELVDLEPGVVCLYLLESFPGFPGEGFVPFLGDDEVLAFGGHDTETGWAFPYYAYVVQGSCVLPQLRSGVHI